MILVAVAHPSFGRGYAALGFRYSDLEFLIKKTCFA